MSYNKIGRLVEFLFAAGNRSTKSVSESDLAVLSYFFGSFHSPRRKSNKGSTASIMIATVQSFLAA